MTTRDGTPRQAAESLADYAYRQLRDQLILLDIAPGAPIVESRLAPELGVGRTPLREALKRLEADHLVVTFARRGTFATNVDLTELSGISEIRHVLVPLAARRAAALQGGSVRDRLSEASRLLESASAGASRRELLELDLYIHRLINEAAESPHLEEALVRLDNLVTRMWSAMLGRIPPMDEHVHEHLALIHAIIEGDSDLAESLAATHVGHFDQAVRSVL